MTVNTVYQITNKRSDGGVMLFYLLVVVTWLSSSLLPSLSSQPSSLYLSCPRYFAPASATLVSSPEPLQMKQQTSKDKQVSIFHLLYMYMYTSTRSFSMFSGGGGAISVYLSSKIHVQYIKKLHIAVQTLQANLNDNNN